MHDCATEYGIVMWFLSPKVCNINLARGSPQHYSEHVDMF